ncbi:efflux RND transporter periplasmic adaptor subunit [Flavobacterium sp.]|jgi:RND family efflux transporter MFP subunit|uniref:efflux RND transporter periplasmic adaptor subunit n=1 Tax=Flavobacterium sp. TaxID=239 RepID=UPI0037BF5410
MLVITSKLKTLQMKNIKYLFVFATLAIMSCSDKKESKTNETEIIAVNLFELQNSQSTSNIETSGLITTENETKLSFKIGGVIDKIFVKEGQSFKAGQLLATLKQTEVEAQVIQAQLALEKSKRDFSRITNLYKDSVATLEQLQNTKTGLEIAEKTLQQASFNKKYAYIYATSAGFVGKKIANEGEIVQGGSPVLIINESNNQKNWIVKVGVSENDWLKIKENNLCKILSNSNQFDGIVTQKSQSIDANSGTFQIEIKIKNATTNLAVGMFSKVNISSSNTEKTTTIPYDAVIEANGKNAFVFIPSSNTTVKKIPIIIESFNEEEVLVSSGLENQTHVIIGNSPFLNEQSKVKIIK